MDSAYICHHVLFLTKCRVCLFRYDSHKTVIEVWYLISNSPGPNLMIENPPKGRPLKRNISELTPPTCWKGKQKKVIDCFKKNVYSIYYKTTCTKIKITFTSNKFGFSYGNCSLKTCHWTRRALFVECSHFPFKFRAEPQCIWTSAVNKNTWNR